MLSDLYLRAQVRHVNPTYVLLTRFAIMPEGELLDWDTGDVMAPKFLNEDWLSYRLSIFQEICVPSVRNQSVDCHGVFGQWALLKWGFTESRDQYDHSTPEIFAGVQR